MESRAGLACILCRGLEWRDLGGAEVVAIFGVAYLIRFALRSMSQCGFSVLGWEICIMELTSIAEIRIENTAVDLQHRVISHPYGVVRELFNGVDCCKTASVLWIKMRERIHFRLLALTWMIYQHPV